MIEWYKSYSAALSKNDKKSGCSEFFDPFLKGSPIKWGAHLYKICLIYVVLKWVLCIKFSRAIFAWKKVKCNIYATVTNMLLFKKMIPKNPADAIIAVMGDGNQCELLTLGNSRRVSLKLGRTWDFGSSRCPITAFMAKSARIWRYHLLFFW